MNQPVMNTLGAIPTRLQVWGTVLRLSIAERLVYRGEIVDAGHWPSGCHLHGRCPLATEKCAIESPPLVEKRPGHFAACWHRE